MQITIDHTILTALRTAIADNGGQLAFAAKTGIGQTVLSRYLSGQICVMRSRNWAALLPHIISYLPPGYVDGLTHAPPAPPRNRIEKSRQLLAAIVDDRPPDMSEEEFRHWQTMQEMTGDWQIELKQAEYEMRQVIMAYLDQMELRQLTGVRDFVRKLTMEGKK